MTKNKKGPKGSGDQKAEQALDSTGRKQEGKYVDLPDAEMGKVVVRFPPEASGFLHIGHAKAALLNQYYQLAFEGKLVFRFDDTNPEKEKEDFEEVIREDVELLRIKPDFCSYTSDHFELYLEKCVELIKIGKAYVDDTPPDVMKEEREQRAESRNRNNSVEKNLEMWNDMVKGTEHGLKCCVRAKIDMQSNNGCMRDPTLYRCKKQPHPKTGDKYNVYPTYDFACPIIDSLEGVTHALRTTEYMDRDVQYYWVIDALGMRKPYIWAYSRLNMLNTVLSKRKLTWFVESGFVEGWDDPRMPTVRGVLRRGMTVDGLKQFIIAQGSSRAVVYMEWDKIWSFNKKVIDPVAPRYAAADFDGVPVNIDDGPTDETIEVNVHPKNEELGKRAVHTGKQVIIDHVDAKEMKEGDSVTFVNWGNLRITKIEKDENNQVKAIEAKLNLDDKNFKKTYKTTWVEASHSKKARFVYYDHIITKALLAKDDDFKDFINKDSKFEVDMLVEEAVASLKKGDIVQILRKGFFICDEPADAAAGKPVRLISIPDGSTDMNIYPKPVQDWKARNQKISADLEKAAEAKAPKPALTSADQLSLQIQTVGDEIRDLKASKADKNVVQEKVKVLVDLKAKYKNATGADWSPSAVSSKPAVSKAAKVATASKDGLSSQIKTVGDEIRDLKSSKADKKVIQEKVSVLVELKAKFKEATGTDWTPETVSSESADPAVQSLNDDLVKQGEKIRELKAAKKNKEELQPEIDILLKLKEEYKKLSGKDWQAPNSSGPRKSEAKSESQPSKKSESGKKEKEKKVQPPKKDTEPGKKQTRLGIENKKSENYADWYTEVITKAELIEYYDVSGCYILRPWSFAIWESIQQYFDNCIKGIGVKNCYFPMFVTQAALEREKDHIADFAPEVAWVTRSGQSEMAEPIAIRPTSETVMYPAFAKWVQSYRDLPIKLNQWCNVVRWEFKNPTPFLRTREFLWQEGHTAYAKKEDAVAEVFKILDFYAEVYEYLLAVPVTKGKKTEKEKFPGGDFTTTIEGYVPSNGRGIQAATSHHLGQNFSKMFEIIFEDPDKPGQKCFAYQNSWGLSTRSIGTMIMMHSDDKGLVLPPRVACVQVVIIPCGITAASSDEDRKSLSEACAKLHKDLVEGGIKCELDDSDHVSPGWKYNHWELKGVPVRIELGPKDLQKQQFIAVRRDTGVKLTVNLDKGLVDTKALLADIQDSLYAKAKQSRDENQVIALTWNEFVSNLDERKHLLSPFCGAVDCEDNIKKDSARENVSDSVAGGGPLMGAKSLCIPLQQPSEITSDMKCIHASCNRKPQYFTLFGRSY
ncbi:Bifunctional glutamate/proline--tRNA ligase [Halotydeus destructor]|nr:Bifunctional glutamate/proline--tRNA ligase [Halotydeus destructor]